MKLNKSLIMGGIILILLLIVSLMPTIFTKENPYGIQTLKYAVVDADSNKVELRQAPFAPSKDALLGTDEIGRDILTFIIYGTRLTLKISLLVTLLRFLLALPLGIFAGFGNSISKLVIQQFNILFNGLPSLLFAVLVLNIGVFASLDKRLSTLAFIVILTLVGWSNLALTVEYFTQNILNKPFITSEYAMGKSRYEVSIENVIPHLMPEITVLFFMEMSRVLAMMIQLGIFSVFIGNLKLIASTDNGVVLYKNISFEPEWASLLGSARQYLRSAPWMIIYPSLAFFISVLGFNLFGEGLRINIQDKNSMFVPKVRKGLMALLIKKDKKFPKKYILVLALFLIIIRLNGQESNPLKGDYDFVDIPNRLLIGMPEIDRVTEALSKKMKEIGMEPLYEGFKKAYDIDQMYRVRSSFLAVNGRALKQDKDYGISGFGKFDVRDAVIMDTSNLSLYAIKDTAPYRGKVLVIEGGFYNDELLNFFIEKFEKAGAAAVLIKTNTHLNGSYGTKKTTIPIILITESLKIVSGDLITIQYEAETLEKKGVNVVGLIPGQDPKIGQEAILIGMPLNYRSKEDGLSTYKYALELLAYLYKRNSARTIIFAFFDGSDSMQYHGLLDYTKKMAFSPQKTILYVDIMNMTYEDQEGVYIDVTQAPETRFFGISFLQAFGKSKDFDIKTYQIPTPVELKNYGENPHLVMFYRKGVTTLVVDVKAHADGFFEALLNGIIKNN